MTYDPVDSDTDGVVESDVNNSSVQTDDLDTKPTGAAGTTTTTDLIDAEPWHDALREGYIVAVAPQYHEVYDPRDFSDAGAALQQANDDLVTAIDNQSPVPADHDTGRVWFPPVDPGSTVYTVSSTVTFGSTSSDASVIPKGWGFDNTFSEYLDCTINDGSAMFEITGKGGGDSARTTVIEGFGATASGNDAEFIRCIDTGASLGNLEARDFNNNTATGVYVFDGKCFNFQIDGALYNGNNNGDGTARVFAFVNETGTSPPGEITINWCNTFDGQQCDIYVPVNVDDLHLAGGRFEGAEATDIDGSGHGACIYGTAGKIYISEDVEFGKIDKVTGTRHQTFWEGDYISVADGTNMGIASGDGVKLGSNFTGDGYIGNVRNENISGDVINVQNDPGSNSRLVVPRESTINGSVTYPSPAWFGVYYSDGWRVFREETDTVNAGDTDVTLNAFGGRDGNRLRGPHQGAGWGTTDPNADLELDFGQVWNDGNGQWEWIVSEVSGLSSGSLDLTWSVEIAESI